MENINIRHIIHKNSKKKKIIIFGYKPSLTFGYKDNRWVFGK